MMQMCSGATTAVPTLPVDTVLSECSGSLLSAPGRLCPPLCDLVFGQQGGERGGMKDEPPNVQTFVFYVLRAYIEL